MDMSGDPKSEGRPKGLPLAFYSFLKQGSSAPTIDELVTNRDYVYFGGDNLFPERMRELADNCTPLDQCIHRNSLFIAGKGLKFLDPNGQPIPEAEARYLEWLQDTEEAQFRRSTALDIAFANSFAWDVRYARDTETHIARIDHKDVSRIRCAKKEDGRVPAYFYSSNWQIATKYKSNLPQKYKHHEPIQTQAFDFESGRDEEIQTIYHKEYKQGKDYYSEPVYLSAVQDAMVWTKVPNFNKTQIDTGFAPSVHLHVPLDKDEANLDEVQKVLEKSYEGSNGSGLFLTWGAPGEEGPVLTPLDAKFRSGELDEVRDKATEIIINANMIPKIISGIDTLTGLGGQSPAIRESVEMYQRTYVEPKQRMFTSKIESLLRMEGIECEVSVAPLDPFEMFGSDQVRLATQTINEIREGEGLGALLDEQENPDERGFEIPGRIKPNEDDE